MSWVDWLLGRDGAGPRDAERVKEAQKDLEEAKNELDEAIEELRKAPDPIEALVNALRNEPGKVKRHEPRSDA